MNKLSTLAIQGAYHLNPSQFFGVSLTIVRAPDLRVDGLPSLAEIVSRELTGAYKTLVEGENMRMLNKKGKTKPVFLQMTPSCHTLKVTRARSSLCVRVLLELVF